jgi:hypothetical protein
MLLFVHLSIQNLSTEEKAALSEALQRKSTVMGS